MQTKCYAYFKNIYGVKATCLTSHTFAWSQTCMFVEVQLCIVSGSVQYGYITLLFWWKPISVKQPLVGFY